MHLQLTRSVAAPETRRAPTADDDFGRYARPLTAKLLGFMELAKHFHHGEGDYLSYLEGTEERQVLDLTGGYGANILGHRHPRVLAKVRQWAEAGAPSLSQASVRAESGRLARRLSEILSEETGTGPWITTFSNSGTEAVEAAIKHCLLHFRHRAAALEQEATHELNEAYVALRRRAGADGGALVASLRAGLLGVLATITSDAPGASRAVDAVREAPDVPALVDAVRDFNQAQLQVRPTLLALTRAYHGKTLGALSLTYNESFREPFYLGRAQDGTTRFVSPSIDEAELQEIVDSLAGRLIVPRQADGAFAWTTRSFSTIAAAFAEPIQGEAGVHVVPSRFLEALKRHSVACDFLLVFDEIQCGMYRTGKLAASSHAGVAADVYTFSKSLGGGVAKIAATAIRGQKYLREFGFLHTSTFSDDAFSAGIALEVLDVLRGPDSPVADGMEAARDLRERLEALKARHPGVVKEIRGAGLMLAIEFHDVFPRLGFEFAAICDARMQGYLMAAALLNHEQLRMSPSLSDALTLRIQPSLYFSRMEVGKLLHGLQNLCAAMAEERTAYFLSAIYPGEPIVDERSAGFATAFVPGRRPLAVFLCHLIDEAHIRRSSHALRAVSRERLLGKLAMGKDVAEFEIEHVQTITDRGGRELDVIMMGIGITSEELKRSYVSRDRARIVRKVQNAVDYAESLGACTVGLGQFTSIVSGNGLYLNPRGLNLTTGNAYTVSLTVQSALRSARAKGIDLRRATVALIGAAGNIMSVASSIMADHVGKLVLVHHSAPGKGGKFEKALLRVLHEIRASSARSAVTGAVQRCWSEPLDLPAFLALEPVREVFEATSDLATLAQADIVLCGASAPGAFLALESFKRGAVIVDVAVPPTVNAEVLARMAEQRPDLTYHRGGIARIPGDQSIDFALLPLGRNEAYACMAETFSLAFGGRRGLLHIGDLDKQVVLEVERLAGDAGFVLGNDKDASYARAL